jgi:hypothetical protein
VKEFHNKQEIDTFYASVQGNNNYCTGLINKKISLANSYEFHFNKNLITLSKMKMITHPTWTMTNENYECVVGEYALNGILHKSVGITITLN